jgi:hypothetical protein
VQFIVEFIFSIVFNGLLWGAGAAVKKLLRRPITTSGISEQVIGFGVICGLVTVIVLWMHQP